MLPGAVSLLATTVFIAYLLHFLDCAHGTISLTSKCTYPL